MLIDLQVTSSIVLSVLLLDVVLSGVSVLISDVLGVVSVLLSDVVLGVVASEFVKKYFSTHNTSA